MNIEQTIRNEIKQSGLTAKEVSIRCGISEQALHKKLRMGNLKASSIEQLSNVIQRDLFLSLSKAYNETIDILIDRIDEIAIDPITAQAKEELNEINTKLKGLMYYIEIDVTREKTAKLLGFIITEKSTPEDIKMYLSRLEQSAETIREHML